MEPKAIHYALLPCELGWVLLAATTRGVCNIRFGDGPHEVVAGLAEEFPFAELREDPARLAAWVAALARYLNGETQRLELPLDVRGSQFQRRVWRAIAAIPCGETRTYGALARAIGHPRAVRAVGQACGANPVALAVPCHRVVAAGGRHGGYRWGLERKLALLETERKAAKRPRSEARPKAAEGLIREGPVVPPADVRAAR